MKTAISLPDETFEAGEQLAKRLRISRSELYARALDRMIKEMDDRQVTELLNQVYASQASSPDPVLSRMQSASIDREDW